MDTIKTHWRTLVIGESGLGKALAARLRADGHHVDTTGSAHEAIDQARERRYYAYFVNFEVGDMDGVEIMKEIRQVQPDASIIGIWPGARAREDEFVSLARRVVAGEASDPGLMSLVDTEKLLITATLRRTGGHITDSAAILGIDRSTLYMKIKKYAIPAGLCTRAEASRLTV